MLHARRRPRRTPPTTHQQSSGVEEDVFTPPIPPLRQNPRTFLIPTVWMTGMGSHRQPVSLRGPH